MVEYEWFVYRDADTILEKKGLLEEIKAVLQSIKKVDHREIQAEFYNKGWAIEHKIFSEINWAWDTYKDKVAVSVELSLIEAVHRDFLRAILAQKNGDLDVLVYITSTFKEPKFQNVKRDIEFFKEILTIPILLENKFENMKNEYYAIRGWDVETGIPTKEKLEKLEMKDIA
jgi:hypothetical protein